MQIMDMEWLANVYAHLPNTLIKIIPAIREKRESVVRRRLALRSSPYIQSCAHMLTKPVQIRMPAEKASRVPMAMMVLLSLPLK